MLQLTVFEIFDDYSWSKILDLGALGYIPKGVKICPGSLCTIVQNFLLIDGTVAKITVTGQRKKQQPIHPSINVWCQKMVLVWSV